MPNADCYVYFTNGELIHHPPLDIVDSNGSIIHNPTGENLPRSRENAIAFMVKAAIKKYNIKDDFSLHIRIADAPWESDGPEPPPIEVSNKLPEDLYSLCVYNNRFDKAFPDFMFVSMPESGLEDYEQTINSFINSQPKTNKIGWVGSCSCGDKTPRPKFLQLSQQYQHILDGREVNLPLWSDSGWKTCTNRMSYQDQINEWKYLIDIEGCGYSGRFKILLNSPRITFFVDRPYQEWFFEYMIPWKHYVPVKRDLSDLIENYLKLESDEPLQKYIQHNQKEFAAKYLTREAAIDRVYKIIVDMIKYKNSVI